MTTANILSQLGSPGVSTGFKNRIINGAMTFDQRNAGASITPTSGIYTLDRWQAVLTVASKYSVQQNAGSVTPPAGFTNYYGVTSLSAYSVGVSDTFAVVQLIEGYNTADLAWGTANAKTVTLSFWVRSSLTGTFGGSFYNGTANRSYLFSFSVNAANTWEQKTITVAGDTTGTWATNSSAGIGIRFGLGSGSTYSGTAGAWVAGNLVQPTGTVSVVGTNGATFYITGVQLEVGTTATNFDVRSYGTELALCQRYYWRTYGSGTQLPICRGYTGGGSADLGFPIFFPVLMRAVPTLTKVGTFATSNCGQPIIDFGSVSGCEMYANTIGAGSAVFYSDNSSAYVTAEAEI